MYKIKQNGVGEAFKRARQAVAGLCRKQGLGGINWMLSDLSHPMAEYLSSRIGNQLFQRVITVS